MTVSATGTNLFQDPDFRRDPLTPSPASNPSLKNAEIVRGRFRLAKLLDQALANPEGRPGPLFSRLQRESSLGLKSAYRDLTSEQKAHLNKNLTPQVLGQIFSLAEETHPKFLAQSTLALARKLESSSDTDIKFLGVSLYQHLARENTSVRAEALERLETLQGRGNLGSRIEHYLEEFLPSLLDPALLIGLGIASTAYKATYAKAFTHLASRWRTDSLLGLWRVRGTAGLMGLGMEVPTWVMAEHGLRKAMGGEVATSKDELQNSMAHATLLLGTLRVFSALGRTLARTLGPAPLLNRWNPEAHFRTPLQILVTQGTQVAGIYSAFSLAETRGMRDPGNPSDRFFDSLSFALHAQSAGLLSSHLLGKSWARFNRRLEKKIQAVEGKIRFPEMKNFEEWLARYGEQFSLAENPQLVAEGLGALGGVTFPFQLPQMVFSKALGKGEAGSSPAALKPAVIEERLKQMTRPQFTPDRFQEAEPPEGYKAKPKITIGVATHGGDGPGENAGLEFVVRGAAERGWKTKGIFDGLEGLFQPEIKRNGETELRIRELGIEDVLGPKGVARAYRTIYGEDLPPGEIRFQSLGDIGGDYLRSSRMNPLIHDPRANILKQNMRAHGIDVLAIFGGNGTQKLVLDLVKQKVPSVFIPQTIDNDVPGSIISLGFPSSVNQGASFIPSFLHTGQSCGRWFPVEVMGQRGGLLTLGIAWAAKRGNWHFPGGESGFPVRVDGIFTEVPRPLEDFGRIVQRRAEIGQRHGVVLVSEGVKLLGEGGAEILPPRGKDAHGRLEIRSGAIAEWFLKTTQATGQKKNNNRTENLAYTIRGAPPVAADQALARVLADGALGLIEKGAYGRMVGLHFPGRQKKLTVHYPRIREAIENHQTTRRDYYEYVRDLLENGS